MLNLSDYPNFSDYLTDFIPKILLFITTENVLMGHTSHRNDEWHLHDSRISHGLASEHDKIPVGRADSILSGRGFCVHS